MAQPQIKPVPIDKLIPYARNARTHSEEQIAQLAAALDEFGMVGAVVVRDGTIAKGHGTLAAIRKLYAAGKRLYPAPGRAAGAEPYPDGTAPATDVSGWSDAQFRAYVIADNKLAQNAGWDEDMLRLEFDGLKGLGLDLALTGFSDAEITTIFMDVEHGKTDPDAEWDGMPTFDQGDAEAFRSIKVHFDNAEQVAKFFALIGQKDTGETRSIWFPKKKNLIVKDIAFVPAEKQ